MTSASSSHIANSQRKDPYFSDWAAMGLSPEPGRTAFDGPKPAEQPKALTTAEKARAYAREYAKKRYVKVADRETAVTEFKATHLNRGPLNESPQAKAKTARLLKAGI